MGIPEVGGVDERVCLYCCGTCQLTSQPARWGRAKNIVICMAIFGHLCMIWFKTGLIALLIVPLQIGIIKSRFHYVRHQNFTFS